MVVFFLFGVCVAVSFAQGPQRSEQARVRATGQAPADLPNARQAAVEDALRRAVEAGMGVEIASETESRDFQLVKDVILAKTAGYVQQYEVLEENADQAGLYTVRVEAIVSRGDIDADAMAFKALLQRKGHPRLMVVGSVDKEPFDARLTAEVQDQLETRGLTVIDMAMLNENQRRAAERMARLDEAPAQAAMIMEEVGADYFVVVDVEGNVYPPRDRYGVVSHPAEATATVKVLRVDTARLLASKVVTDTVADPVQRRAVRKVTSRVTQSGAEQAIARIAENWLDDVDQRGGQQIELIFYQFDFDRLNRIVTGLRETGGVKNVSVDSTNAAGRSRIRVITNNSAADVGSVIRKLDQSAEIEEASKYQLNIRSSPRSKSGFDTSELTPWIAGGIGAVVLLTSLIFVTMKKRT